MKRIFKILGILIVLILFVALGLWFYLKSTAPKYKGTIDLADITAPVEVSFDGYGIPHIYAKNAKDAFHALGYVHAQDRLFQMEMIRRLVSGQLSELVGPNALKTDKLFLNLRLRDAAQRAADKWFSNTNDPVVIEANAYLQGINDFIDQGKMPIEFRLLKIPKRHFKPVDIYLTLEYMTLGFTAALKEEPVLTKIYQELGADYIKNWDTGTSNMFQDSVTLSQIEDLSFFAPMEALEEMAMPLWEGSNGWVLSPKRSKSGKVLFANDTHIGFSQPSVWYEAHMEYPGFSFYGNYLAGVPFPIIGHSREIAYGLTIFPMDNMDLYKEKINPENPLQVWENDHWATIKTVQEIINIKGDDGIYQDTFWVNITRHGPIIKEANDYVANEVKVPVSLKWGALEFETRFLHCSRNFTHATTMEEAKTVASELDILGLNVLYGDATGNIAKWSTGKIPIRPAHVNSKLILDGASGKDEWLGYYDFSKNPKVENPEIGFVASSNEAPPVINGTFITGYYPAEGRKPRLLKRLAEKEKWSLEAFKTIQLDNQSDVHKSIAQAIIKAVPEKEDNVILKILKDWDGSYQLEDAAPTVFTKLAFEIMETSMIDELGQASFDALSGVYLFKNNYQWMIPDAQSPWWDDVRTKDIKESQKDIFAQAIDRTEKELKTQFGDNPRDWKWRKVHQVTHIHPIGRKPSMAKYFNVGPFPIAGSNGTLNKLGFTPNSTGKYEVLNGPALRILLDFADVEHSESINPTGQSGNVFSPHYQDQAQKYVDGVYRKQLMNPIEIRANGSKLTIK